MGFVKDVIGDVADFAMDIVGDVTGSKAAGKAAQQASATQAAAAQAGIEEQRRQFDALVQLLSPYVSAGAGALPEQQALLGLRGAGAQQRAISGIEESPIFQALAQQGEQAILQQASATGGLRGGNVQAALAQFRPQMLNQLIEQQYSRLGGLSQLGQASASMQAAQGLGSASNIANLLANQAQAVAGGQLAAGSQRAQLFGNTLGLVGAAPDIGKGLSSIGSGLGKVGGLIAGLF